MPQLAAPIPFAGVFTTDTELPREDRTFADLWLVDLVRHWGEWRHPREVAPNALYFELCTAARDARARAEHDGWLVESGEHGYRVVGYRRPEGMRMYRYRPGPRRANQDEEDAEIPGQLCIGEVG
jgi:hypothetical protein